jgi:hypothetical protein
MGRREELLRAEDGGWRELSGLLARLNREQMEGPGLTPEGWSVKDLIGHLACWMAEAARELERIRLGTYEPFRRDIEEVNREFYEACLEQDLPTLKVELAASRNRMLQEWQALPEITPPAEEWFEESGPRHYAEHVDELRRWVESLTATAS